MRGIHVIRPVKILLVCLFFAVLAGVVTGSSSQAAKKGDYQYDTCEGGVEITYYTGKDKNVKIPDRIAGKEVVSIGMRAFHDNKAIKKVTIPDTVETIEMGAFEGCINLKKIKFSKNLKEIDDYAFESTGLVQVNIPDSVKYIGSDVFHSCKNLKKVHLGKNIKIIKYSCFEECTNLLSINLENIEEIEEDAFKNDKSITGVLNLDSVTTIEKEAFYGCSGIKEVHFSDSLQRLGYKRDNPFVYCAGIEKFTISKENSNYTCVDGVIYGKSDDSLVAWPAHKAEAVVLGSNVRKIYDYAFSGAQITSIVMEGQVNYIGEKAFAKSMITQASLPLPDNSKKIRWSYDAFKGCRMLVRVIFPDKSVSSNEICFLHCTSLREVVLPDTMTELSDGMFLGCTALESITLPKSITRIPGACFYKCSRLKNVNLENIAEIGVAAFSHCSSLAGTISLNAQKIGVLSFDKCTNIVEVKFTKPLDKILFDREAFDKSKFLYHEIPKLSYCEYTDISFKRLQSNPFAGCSSLTSVSVPEGGGVRSIDGVLYSADMKELVAYPAALAGKFNVPYGVESICSFAFQDSALTELVTANSVRNIYYCAMYGSSIKSVTMAKNVKYMEESALDGCMQLESIKVHASNKVYESDDGVLYTKGSKGWLLLYPSAKKGAKYTVRNKAGLTPYAFDSCKYLKKVIIDEGVAVNTKIFYKCKNIKLYITEGVKSYNEQYYDKYTYNYKHVFHKTCKGCRVYVKKNSPLVKYFDKKKVKYKTY